MVLAGRDVIGETLESRRALLEREILPKLTEPIRYSPELPGSVSDLIQSVKAQKLEGWSRNDGTAATSRENGRAPGRCA
jgi:ATP-dependent DNA ligase